MQVGAEVYHNLKKVIGDKYGQDACNVGDEGGFAPNVQDNTEALDVLMTAIKKSGHEAKVKIGTDIAASEFYKDGKDDWEAYTAFTKQFGEAVQVVGDDLLVTNTKR